MANSEWSLIFFTLLAQTAVGAFLFWELPRVFGSSNLMLKNKENLSPYLIFTCIALLSLFISFFHLGDPLHAFYSLNNLKESWLSREILFAALFAGLMVLVVVMEWRGFLRKSAGRVVSLITILIGLAFVFSMAKIYMLPTVLSWNSPSTIIEFFTTTFLLGLTLAVGIGKKESARESAIYLLTILPILLFIKLTNLLFITSLMSVSGKELFMSLNTLRAVALLLAAILMVSRLLKKKSPQEIFHGKLFYFLTALILISEITGRYLFYAGFVSVGI
jgi:DMSO reductase anchor subunit